MLEALGYFAELTTVNALFELAIAEILRCAVATRALTCSSFLRSSWTRPSIFEKMAMNEF